MLHRPYNNVPLKTHVIHLVYVPSLMVLIHLFLFISQTVLRKQIGRREHGDAKNWIPFVCPTARDIS